MGFLEGSSVSVLYIGRTAPKGSYPPRTRNRRESVGRSNRTFEITRTYFLGCRLKVEKQHSTNIITFNGYWWLYTWW
jgi:hypothetical protein